MTSLDPKDLVMQMQEDAEIPRIFMLFAQRGPTMVPKYHRRLTLRTVARFIGEMIALAMI